MNLILTLPSLLAIQRLPIQTLIMIGALAGVGVVFISYSNWRRAVKAAFIILLLEGAIRKWVFQSGQELVYFLKDGVLLGAYIRFYLAPDPELRAWKLRAPAGLMALLATVVALSGMNPNIGSLLLALYGVKIYVYYIPLAFMMPYLFRSQEDMIRQLCWYAVLAVPICLLGALQFKAGTDSALNVYSAQDATAVAFNSSENVRVTGTFSYISGHTTFVVFFITLHLTLLLCTIKRAFWWLLLLDLPLLLANAFMGGSRASVGSAAFVIAGILIAGLFTKVTFNKNMLVVFTVGMFMALAGTAYFFKDAMKEWTTRAENSDTVAQRVYDHPAKSLQDAIRDGGVTGYGIGLTHPAVVAMRGALDIPRPAKSPPVYDLEVAQVLIELGALGFIAWYALRLMALAQGFFSFINCKPGSLRTLVLAATLIQIPFLLMSVVLNHIANFFLWGCYGLTLIPRLQSAIQRRVPADMTAPATNSLGQRIQANRQA